MKRTSLNIAPFPALAGRTRIQRSASSSKSRTRSIDISRRSTLGMPETTKHVHHRATRDENQCDHEATLSMRRLDGFDECKYDEDQGAYAEKRDAPKPTGHPKGTGKRGLADAQNDQRYKLEQKAQSISENVELDELFESEAETCDIGRGAREH